MSMDLERFCWMVSFTIPLAVELSVWIGVDGCRCPISSREWQRGTAKFAFSNRAPISAYAADTITFHKILQRDRIAPF